MAYKKYFYVTVFAVALAFFVAGCAGARSPHAAQSVSPSATSSPTPAPSPKEIVAADLKKLRWIEGSWRGTGGGVPTFYERYRFENDSTLVVEGLADETLKQVNDASRFELKDGHFGYNNGDTGSVAVALDDNGITFGPTGKSRNFFRWQRESENVWKALLNWTDKNGAPKERIYVMERWPPHK
jgi:hypothetical protein